MTERDELLALADSIEGWGQTFGGKQSPGIVKIPLTKSDRAAIVAALRDLRARPAMPDDDEDVRTFDDGVQHTVLLLAKWLDAEGWEMCDGSEDYDTDLGNTLLSILAAKGLYDKDECKWASLTAPSQGDAGAQETYIEICKNKNCPRGGLPVEIVAPVPPDAGWLAPALDKAAARAAKMPGWMTRSSSATPSVAGAHQSAPISQAAQNTAESDPSVMPGYVGAGTVPSDAGALREALDYSAWLIEISEPSGPKYFQFVHDDDWTDDHDKAAHFARRQDAERVIEHHGWTRAKPSEHLWPAPVERDVIAQSNGHHWIKAFNLTCCRDCGIVRRADDQNKPCKGVTSVGPRAALSAPATGETE